MQQDYRLRLMGAESQTEPLRNWLADRRVASGLNLEPRVYSTNEIRKYVSSFDGHSAALLSIDAGGTPVGIATVEFNPRHRTATWSLVIGEREHRTPGRVIAIAISAVDWVFASTATEKLSSRIAAHKMVPIFMLDRVGVPREGYLRGEMLSPNGARRHDEVIHGLLRSEWPDIRRAAIERLSRSVS